MEITLAIVVASAVVFFGALISMGNERQKKAIDDLREQVILWAMQDLKIKRKVLAGDIKIIDPLVWFNQIATKAIGFNPKLKLVEVFEEPHSIVCLSNEGKHIVFSTYSPKEIRRFNYSRKTNRLNQSSNRNPFLKLRRDVKVFEISLLNGGVFFDLELNKAWDELSGTKVELKEQIWIYVY